GISLYQVSQAKSRRTNRYNDSIRPVRSRPFAHDLLLFLRLHRLVRPGSSAGSKRRPGSRTAARFRTECRLTRRLRLRFRLAAESGFAASGAARLLAAGTPATSSAVPAAALFTFTAPASLLRREAPAVDQVHLAFTLLHLNELEVDRVLGH